MATTPRITPNIWFQGNAGEAVEFYLATFGGDSEILKTVSYPETGLPDFQREFAGQILVSDFSLRGYRMTALNAGEEFTPTPAISFTLNFDPVQYPDADAARADLDALWHRLSAGGQMLMPLQEYDFSRRYGWVQDRYGVSWQLILTDPEGDPRPFIMPTFMFGGSHQNLAAEAIDYWTGVFPNSSHGAQVRYTKSAGPATTASLMFSDFTLDQQWFVAMDSAVEQDHTFTEGLSLLVACEDQAEIDYYWEALSAVPEAEQCGWCKDRFGVSWQIVPQQMDQLMQHPGAYQHMLSMKKLVIVDI